METSIDGSRLLRIVVRGSDGLSHSGSVQRVLVRFYNLSQKKYLSQFEIMKVKNHASIVLPKELP
jgi:hypothetical protein